METAQRKVQTAVEEMVGDIDRNYLRKMQRSMHACAMKCCDNTSASSTEVQQCVDRCQTNVQEAAKAMEAEMSQYQQRLMRCAQGCEDKAKDKMGGETDPKKIDMDKIQKGFETCVVSCADEHVALLPSIRRRLEGGMKRML